MTEIWKRLPKHLGYLPIYEASSKGRFRSIGHFDRYHRWHKTRYLSVRCSKVGYLRVHLRDREFNNCTVSANRTIAETFLRNPHHRPYVTHKDGNPTNNNINNLQWSDSVHPNGTKRCRRNRKQHLSRLKTYPLRKKPISVRGVGKRERFHHRFPTMIAAAKYLHRRCASRSVGQYYISLSKLVNKRIRSAYGWFTAYSVK